MKISELTEAKGTGNNETQIRRIVLANVDAVKGANIIKTTRLEAGPKGTGTMEFRVQYASNSFPGKEAGVEDINVGYDGTAKIIMATIKDLKKSAPLEFVGLRVAKGKTFMPKSAADVPAEGDPVLRYVFKAQD